MKIKYIRHSSFLIELEKYVLIFDLFSNINLDKYKDKRIIFFASHSHEDHFNNLIFTDYENKNCFYILGNDINKKENENIKSLKPYEEFYLDDLKINTFGSTDRGVSFLVQVENKRIFHSGDLNWWHWANNSKKENEQEKKDYIMEVDILKDYLKNNFLDVAFIPTDERLGKGIFYALNYFAKNIKCKNIFPMHFWKGTYKKELIALVDELKENDLPILYIPNKGEEINI